MLVNKNNEKDDLKALKVDHTNKTFRKSLLSS